MKKTNHTGFYLKLNNESDKQIIERLKSVPNRQGYIKDLIQTDIELDFFRNGGGTKVEETLNSGQRKFVHSAYRSKIPKVQISDEEYNILKEYYPTEGGNIIKRLPNRTISEISIRWTKISSTDGFSDTKNALF